MCTVTYIPTANGFVLTSNRDELLSRADVDLVTQETPFGEALHYPKDPQANGTWFGFTPTRLVCLLNGGFIKHKRNLPYRKSRGLMVLELFDYQNVTDFTTNINLQNIEPFTLISVEGKTNLMVTELVWDGEKKWLTHKVPSQSHIWSSATLYSAQIKERRLACFNNIKPYDAVSVLGFHQHAGTELGLEQQFKMKREGGLQTISTTQLEKTDKNLRFCHIGYVNQTVFNQVFELTN